jgi:hypothetical protein
VSRVVLILIPLVIIGWGIYHYVVIRPAPWGVRPPDASHDVTMSSEDRTIDCAERPGAQACARRMRGEDDRSCLPMMKCGRGRGRWKRGD